MRISMTICVALGMVLAVSSPALATIVTLVPDSQNVAPGSTVTVSVNTDIDSPFTMTAISAVILYDPAVFTYVPPVVQGVSLKDDWTGGFPIGDAATAGQLRVAAIDWNGIGENVLGNETLFTFALQANSNAPLGPSALTWGYAGGTGDLDDIGLDYGDANGQDVVLPSDGTSINVTPEPATLALLGLGGVGFLIRRRRARK